MTCAPDRSQEYAPVRELREWVKRCDRSRSDKTQSDYERTYERMVRSGSLPEDAIARQTYYKRRAALVWASLERTKDACEIGINPSMARLSGNPPWTTWSKHSGYCGATLPTLIGNTRRRDQLHSPGATCHGGSRATLPVRASVGH